MKMRAIKSLLVATAVVGLVMMTGIRLFATPLLPSFPSVWDVDQEVAGQTDLGADTEDGLPKLQIDWIVKFLGTVGPGGAPVWAYYYQIENTTPTTVSAFTVLTPGPPFFLAGGVGLGYNLDEGFVDPLSGSKVSGHNAINFGNLATETEPNDPIEIDYAEDVGLDFDNTTWKFSSSPHNSGELPPAGFNNKNWQSEVLIAYAFAPPMYSQAEALDSPVIGPWKSTNKGGQLVPVPSPEPAVTLLLITGILGLGTIRWRRTRS